MWMKTTSSYARDRVLMSRWKSDNGTAITSQSDWRIYIPANSSSAINFEVMDFVSSAPRKTGHTSALVVGNGWHHIAATFERISTGPTYTWNMAVMVDGNLDTTLTTLNNNSVSTTTSKTYIGAQYDSGVGYASGEAIAAFGEGHLDETSVWSRALNLTEAKALWNSGCPTDLDGMTDLVSWWRMGDAPQDYIASSPGVLEDVVGTSDGEIYPQAKNDMAFQDEAPEPCLNWTFVTCSFVAGCKTQYDNWWVQHPIPRSDYQYAWITASAITSSGCDFIGHAGSPDCGRNNFSVPSGSSESMAAPTIQFVTASVTGAGGVYVDFVGMNTLVYDPMFTASNLLSSSNGSYLNTSLATIESYNQLNSLNLHRNGPYQYPSWKQIRTGQNPVARYQRSNNIISFKKEVDIYGSNEVTPANAGLTRDTLIHFTTPPVTFRYKPVTTTLMVTGSPNPLALDSVYGNNMGGFPNPDINNFLGTSIKCEEQMFDRIKGMYHNAPSDSPVQEMVSIDYNEIVYPREIHAGLKEYRQRTEYAEVANGTNIYSGGKVIFVSASLSNGSNGIDRGPLYRRTFWRNDPVFRNRRIGQGLIVVSPTSKVPIITGALPNSQGHYDGFATSINGWGNTPVSFVDSLGGIAYTWNLSGSQAPGTMTLLDYPDMGELNSANFQTISGYGGTAGYSDPAAVGASILKLPVSSTYYPTASAYYYHQHIIYNNALLGTSSLGMKWRVAELSGKNPWFDTYEDYVQYIRGTGKSFTIIPEFRISQHMDYYADGLFRKQNDQFLTLDGATITSSAVAPTSSDLSRGFDKQFFSEYSNTDFQKYFGKFDADNQVK